jgi:hypothetical protein
LAVLQGFDAQWRLIRATCGIATMIFTRIPGTNTYPAREFFHQGVWSASTCAMA